MGTVFFTACNDGGTDTAANSDSATITNTTTETTVSTDTGMNNNGMTTGATTSTTPLEGMDKTFVLKAASGGMMEVEAGKIAQENAASQRVKDYGAMMVKDHGMANEELKAMVSAKGMMIPEDSLMAKHKGHLDEMRKMKGAAFDKHYMNMMLKDHNKDIADFEKASTGAMDADVKSFATKNLPVLRMHKDSVQAISGGKK